MIKNKTLVSFSSYNSPHFLEHLVESIERHDAGESFDLLIVDHNSDNPEQNKLLEKYAKKHRIEKRENHGRAQGSYNYVWQNNKDYKYYFFMHDDSVILKNDWLKKAVNRVNDQSLEKVLNENETTFMCGYTNKPHQNPVGKVGFQAFEWGNGRKYFRTQYNQTFWNILNAVKFLNIQIPNYYQHINDDKILYTNECLQAINHIWNIEDWKQKELANDPIWLNIQDWFRQNGLYNNDPFPPYERYGSDYHTFQTISEFLNDIAPMQNGFRTHCILGDGYCQEELSWNSFWGNEYIAHYGDHVVFKRLSLLMKSPEQEIRKRFKDKVFLNICDNIIKKETKNII